MSSFFTTPASQKKRKRQDVGTANDNKRRNVSSSNTTRTRSTRSTAQRHRSESISGSGSEDERASEAGSYESEGSEDDVQHETVEERRLRLAEQYLENVRQEVDEAGFDAAEIDKDLIAERLKEDVAESKGKVYRHIASTLDFRHATRTFFRADQVDVTAVACCTPYVYTVAKDMSIVKWEIPGLHSDNDTTNGHADRSSKYTPAQRPMKLAFARGRRSHNRSYLGHTSQILCAAASSTGRFLATGGLDRRLVVWDVSNPTALKPLKVFTQHRDAVTGLAFRKGTNQLYSCSRDRTVKVWSLDELAYVETLFGHQDSVVGVASASREVCISIGARDRTARLWKVGEETQLVFRGGGIPANNKLRENKRSGRNGEISEMRLKVGSGSEAQYAEGSIDVVAIIDDESFVTGADNGSISLWNIHKKKPVAVIPLAHGVDPPLPLEDVFAEQDLRSRVPPAPPGPRWITALTTIPYSDVVLSGSWDGTIKAWSISEDKRSLQALGDVSRPSNEPYVNGDETTTINGNSSSMGKKLQGVVTDIVAFEKGERGTDGMSIVAGVSTELRLGRWKRFAKRSTAVVFDVPRARPGGLSNGLSPVAEKSSLQS